MNEALICSSILRNYLITENFQKSIDKAVHTNNCISASYFNAIVDVLEEMIDIDKS